ncbi:Cyanophycinase [Agromyces sp. NDB4Y10]|uniref:cyanophycinase n=1 Tax=Agromyces sp. NDB4Y10 TaxID=1775951 RepID=UPI0007B31948|nr:cyanophycinase [Agromyces sp. NDB4Y10]KZE92881.1 Cyanophycinase [Agromyces sp. NDB4Y10]
MTPRTTAAATIAATVAVACLVGASPAVAAPKHGTTSAPAGSLVLIGGNLKENATILQRIVDLADPDGDGPAKARIAIVTAASSAAKTAAEAADDTLNNASANGLYYSALFERFGAETYAVPIDTAVNFAGDRYKPSNANDPKVAREVAKATGVFFGGGDQMRYVRTLFDCKNAASEAFTSCTDTKVMSAVRGVLDRGGVVSGVSAGTTIQQGADMVTGGEPYQAWRDGTTPGYLDDASALAHLPYGGFGFFPEGQLDSHFGTWGRQARMIKLADQTGHDLVVGVDETTALVYDRATRQGEVIGRNGVSLLDTSETVIEGAVGTGTRWSYLVAGDRVDFGTGAITPASERRTGAGTDAAPAPVADVWDSIDNPDAGVYSLVDLGVALVASVADRAEGTTFETDPQYRTVLERTDGTSWWDGGFEGLAITISPAD